MTLAIRYVMFSTVLLGFWCGLHVLPEASAQAPAAPAPAPADPYKDALDKAQQASDAADRQASAAKALLDKYVKVAKKTEEELDTAQAELDVAKLIADDAETAFKNAKDADKASAEEAFLDAARNLKAKQRKLDSAKRKNDLVQKELAAAKKNSDAKDKAAKDAEKDLRAKKAAYEASQTDEPTKPSKGAGAALTAPPSLCPDRICDPSPTSAETIKCLTDRIKKNPCHRPNLIARGEAYLSARLPSAAEADFREALRWNPDDVEALVGWARAAEEQQCWHTAIARYNRAVAAAERALQPVPGQLCCFALDPGTCLYCATLGRARTHIGLANSDDAKNCELETMLDADEETATNRALVHSEAALHDFTQAVRYAPCTIDLACVMQWIDHAQDRCEEHRATLRQLKSSRRASKASAYQATG